MKPKTIRIQHAGNTANRMFQYMFAKTLQDQVKNATVTGYDLPEWRLFSEQGKLPKRHLSLTGHVVDISRLIYLLNNDIIDGLDCSGLFFRLEYYREPAFYNSMFQDPQADSVEGFSDEYLVINIRGKEILQGVHKDYTPLPLAFYQHVINATGLKPVFMGQLEDNFYSAELRKRFPSAIFLPSRGILSDFGTIRKSSHIVISVSTFSWLAAWLSQAKTIHMAVSGMFNPLQRRDINLLPLSDPRYQFYAFPRKHWRASRKDILSLLADRPNFQAVSHEDAVLLAFPNIAGYPTNALPKPSPLELLGRAAQHTWNALRSLR